MEEYDVEINGMMTTLQLTAADAEARGLTKKAAPAKEGKAPANKQAPTPQNKGTAKAPKA